MLRDGRTVEAGPAATYDVQSVVAAMIGSTPASRSADETAATSTHLALEVRDLTVPGAVHGADVSVRKGEIVGIAGLVGAGRSELLANIFAPTAGTTGSLAVNGRTIPTRSIRGSLDAGIGYVPPDRANGGLLLDMSVRANLTVARDSGVARWRRPRPAQERHSIQAAVRRMRIRTSDPELAVSSLSGGNQQKVAVARWLAADIHVLLLDEPTRGVDVNAKLEIHEIVRNCARDGMSVLVSSSEYDELLDMCDRILVMFRGRIVAELPRAAANEETISRIAGGHL